MSPASPRASLRDAASWTRRTTLTLTPKRGLQYNKRYKLTLAGTIQDTDTDPSDDTMDVVIGHFDVILRAADVLAASELPLGERVAVYKLLFSADPRIQGVTDSEEAVAQMEADVDFPVTVSL